jgi:hypothetical protein
VITSRTRGGHPGVSYNYTCKTTNKKEMEKVVGGIMFKDITVLIS